VDDVEKIGGDRLKWCAPAARNNSDHGYKKADDAWMTKR